MNTARWPQEIVVKPMEEIIVVANTPLCPKPSSSSSSSHERKVRPQKEQALNCPRCNSTNTKFCYYNNYSLSQPRYFCKTCRRYWTEGGSLRNIPVGGGSRKHNKRSSSSNNNSSIISKNIKLPDLVPQQNPNNNNKIHDDKDLNLGINFIITTATTTPHDFKTITELIQVPNFDQNKDISTDHQLGNISNNTSSSSNSSSHHLSALELLTNCTATTTTTTTSGRGIFNSFIPLLPIAAHDTVYNSLLPPSLNFSLDGLGSNYGCFPGVQETTTTGKLLFPFEDLKQQQQDRTEQQHQQQQNTRDDQPGNSTDGSYWNGVIGTRGSW